MSRAPSSAGRFLVRFAASALGVGLAALVLPPANAGPLPGTLETNAPQSLDDLKAIQKQVKVVLEKVVPCTVGLQVGGASGSGVLITADGYVLTAGHVSGKPDQDVVVILSDGSRVKGKTLGQNTGIDSGLIKITDKHEGPWPHAEMGNSAVVKLGQWVISTGHPGGYKKGRSPVVRLGRVQEANDDLIRSDCTLVGGDSGGPLFDLEGKVIGIHSRIGLTISTNIHVPVDTYRETWDRLAKSETWGGRLGSRPATTPYLGLEFERDAPNCKIAEVKPDSPAAKAGLKVDDLVTKFDGSVVATFDDLLAHLRKKKPGDEVFLEVTRNKESLKLKVVIGKNAG